MQALPPLPTISGHRTALFLDFDGTLVDLASEPDAVQVPADLVQLLTLLRERVQGALALISGRRLQDLDAFLAPLRLPAAAEHGAQLRRDHGRVQQLGAPNLQYATRAARALVAQHPGLLLEVKAASIALHYRQAPELEALCLQVMSEAAGHSPDAELLCGKSVVELKPSSANKGLAIKAFMNEGPFAGRTPIFAGDDATDEAGFALVQSLGGESIKVGVGPTVAPHRCENPAQLRAWLAMGLHDSIPSYERKYV